MLPFSQLVQWDAAAEFIADHLNYELLDPAHELVRSDRFLSVVIPLSLLAEDALVTHESSRRSTWQLFRLCESSLFNADRCGLRCLCRQWLCDPGGLLHGHDPTEQSVREETPRSELKIETIDVQLD